MLAALGYGSLRFGHNEQYFVEDAFSWFNVNRVVVPCCLNFGLFGVQLTIRQFQWWLYFCRICVKPLLEPMHYNDVIMGTIASQITSLTTFYSTVYSDADQRKHQSSASLAFVRGIHRGPVNSVHKRPVTRKMFPFDDVIMSNQWLPSFQTCVTES